jgi:hypothetical protein
MAIREMGDCDARLSQPGVDQIERLLHVQWPIEDQWARAKPDEPEQNGPGECDGSVPERVVSSHCAPACGAPESRLPRTSAD